MTNSDMILKALLQARIEAFEEVVNMLESISPKNWQPSGMGNDFLEGMDAGQHEAVERIRTRLNIDIEATGNVLAKIKD